jgi:hypothetical protein
MRFQGQLVFILVFAMVCSAQQPNPKPKSSAHVPSLGFSKDKDISPIFDLDAFMEESELKKKLPDNQFVGEKRALHEGALLHDFMQGFQDSKECQGITFYLKKDKVPDFTVQISVNNHDTPGTEQEWIWRLSDTKKNELAGLGNQTNAQLAARDVCMTVWEDVDPNHYKKSGGRIE